MMNSPIVLLLAFASPANFKYLFTSLKSMLFFTKVNTREKDGFDDLYTLLIMIGKVGIYKKLS